MGEFKPKMVPFRPGDQVQVDLKNAVPKVCGCGGELFISVFKVCMVSALASPTGQELLVQQPVLVCMKCEAVMEMKGGLG